MNSSGSFGKGPNGHCADLQVEAAHKEQPRVVGRGEGGPNVSNLTLPRSVSGDAMYVKRIEWIDLVKACSVLLVVFMHATNLMADLAGDTAVAGFLRAFNAVVEPLRMPVFFLVSGMLAASAIHRPWRSSTTRTTGMVYLYVIWMALFIGFQALLGISTPEPVLAVLFAKSGYWYLYAMALFFVIARVLRSQPAWVVVAIALLPNLLRPAVDAVVADTVPGALYTSMAMNLCFFLLGAYFKPVVAGIAARATWLHTLVLGAIALPFAIWWMTNPALAGLTYFPVSVLLLAFGISLAVQVTRDGAPAWAGYLGVRTLPIYVWQWPVIFLAAAVVPNWALGHPLAQVGFPLGITALVALTSVWLHKQPSFRHFFTAPSWILSPYVRIAPAATVTAGR